MAVQTEQPFRVNEGCTAELDFQIEDEQGADLPSAVLSEMKLWVYTLLSGQAIINGRDGVDVLGPGNSGTNDVVIQSDGSGIWYMQPEDNPILSTVGEEPHEAFLQWKWNPGDGNGPRRCSKRIRINVCNMPKL